MKNALKWVALLAVGLNGPVWSADAKPAKEAAAVVAPSGESKAAVDTASKTESPPPSSLPASGAPTPSAIPASKGPWEQIFTEAGRKMEIDPASVKKEADGKVQAWGRIVFEKPLPDAVSGNGYRVLEALNRYNCEQRTVVTIKRVYRKDETTLLREEDSKSKAELPVRSGTLDDKVLRLACKPSGVALKSQFGATVEKAKSAAEPRKELMRTNLSGGKGAQAVGDHAAATHSPATAPAAKSRTVKASSGHAAVDQHRHIHWSYEGEGGPDNWAKLGPENALCDNGKRQSPIDIRDGIKVDLSPIQFRYKPAQFRIIDNGHTVQVVLAENSINVMGKDYELVQFHFHKPSEEKVNGRAFDMVVHLVHRSDDKQLAVVAVLLEKGVEHPVIQTLWNYLPLEKNVDVYPPNVAIDLNQLLPEKKDYFTYMGSLTTPPCSEGVLWMVFKNPVAVSPDQVSIFSKLYKNNARPIQPGNTRLIKESR